jgi:hypothetical protein
MAKTFIIDLRYLLDSESESDPDSSLSLQLVEYLTAIVAMVSYPASESPSVYEVRCQHRDTDGNQCTGHILGEIVSETGNIYWRCPVCSDKGLISNWQGTFWDLCHA